LRIVRIGSGALLGLLALLLLWAVGLVDPPESLSRRLAVLSAVYPEKADDAVAERIPCPPLRRLRLYVVCTERCEGVWRIVGVRGLLATNIQNLIQPPTETPLEARVQANAAIAREHLSLDARGAQEMVGCYLRLSGLAPELVLGGADAVLVERARGQGEEAMAAIAASFDDPDAAARIRVRQTAAGYAATLFYWDRWRPGEPIESLEYLLARDGRLLSAGARDEPLTGGTASDNIPDRSPP